MNRSSLLAGVLFRQRIGVGVFTLACAAASWASDGPSVLPAQHGSHQTLRANIRLRLAWASPTHRVDVINVDEQIFDTNAGARYLMAGQSIERGTPKKLTQATLEQDEKIDFASLPLSHAIKTVKGNGSRKMAVFADPYCPYCKALERTIAQLDNVTVYTFLFPILRPESKSTSDAIWCAKDASAAWSAWMLGGISPASSASCVTSPAASNIALAKGLGIHATPTTVFENGRRQVGALPIDELDAALDAGKS